MLTSNGFKARMKRLLELTDMNDTVADIVEELTVERNEVDPVLRNHSKSYPDDGEIFDFEERDAGDDWKAKYDDLKEKYTRRFFRNDESGTTTAIMDVSKAEEASVGMEGKDGRLEEEEQKGIDSLFRSEEKGD